ncbi:MAG: chitobiase/beta-hexosaminidase C-terminal domain-containing protein [Terracidiphilus sp.]
METPQLNFTLMKSCLLLAAFFIFSFFTFFNGAAYAQTCAGISLGTPTTDGISGNLNGFVPFPSTNAWNTNIASAPVDPNSAAIAAQWNDSGAPYTLHSVFGPSPSDGGIPYIVVDSTVTTSVPINVIDAVPESDVVVAPYPSGDAVPIEGAPADCSGWPDTYIDDAHTLVLDRATCWLYETYQTNRCNGLYDAYSETIWDMTTNEHRPWGWTSGDAAGLSIFAGLVRYDEVASGAIHHAFRFSVETSAGNINGGYFVLPAVHAASHNTTSLSPMGMRVRLKASKDISSYSQTNQIIFTAMKNYGLILADNGGNFFVVGDTDPHWDLTDLGNWHYGPAEIKSTDFEVIQSTPEFPGWDAVTAYTANPGSVPVINGFTATATSVSSGTAVTFNFSVTGDSYDFIDNIGPVRLTAGSGSMTISPTQTQEYTLYSTNSSGRTVSDPILVAVPGSQVSAPVFTPPAGTFTTGPTVSLSTPTSAAAEIYYTTDGSQPNSNSTVYSNSSPINISSTLEVTAYAIVNGYAAASPTSTAIYVINANGAPPNFTVSTDPSNISVTPGAAGATVGVTITSQYGFNSAVSFTCSDLPAGSNCSFSPTSVTPTAVTPAKTTLTITSTGSSSAVPHSSSPIFPGAALAIAFCFFGLRSRRRLQMVLLLAASVVGLGVFTGCGSPSSAPPPPPTTTTILVTATSGSLTNTAKLVLTVQ